MTERMRQAAFSREAKKRASRSPTMARCSRCGEEKPRDQFHRRPSPRRGVHAFCKLCSAAYSRDWWKKAERPNFEKYLSKNYGITVEDWARAYNTQGGCCAICGCVFPVDRVDTDHCHRTGAFRGLLCRPCNKGLGAFRDCAASLRAAAAEYLEQQR